MHCPAVFRETRLEVLYQTIRAYPLATLITVDDNGPCANLVPFSLHVEGSVAQLRAHLARNNPQLQHLRAGAPVLVAFQGPQHYISPNLYPSKAEHGKVVPTWNYVMVQVRGPTQVIDTPAWLLDQVNHLTNTQEAAHHSDWQVSDAPDDFIAAQLKGIVGLTIDIAHIEGKWKVSQNRTAVDQLGVVTGLQHSTAGHTMAACVAEHLPPSQPTAEKSTDRSG
jgi:transcriptional regulator